MAIITEENGCFSAGKHGEKAKVEKSSGG